MSETKEIKLTPQQQAVVENRGGNLLVSAAAGSGKTKVLVDRIMSRICDEKKNITDFVIITFTKAAATELRAKITNELSKRLADDMENEHLRKQLQLVCAANISTVHAFCSKLLRSQASVIGLPSDFRVAEQQESLIIRTVAMEDMLEDICASIEKRPNAKAFLEDFSIGRNFKAVPAIIYDVYDIMQSHPWPTKWMENCIRSMDVNGVKDAAETPWGAYIMKAAKDYILTQLPIVQEAKRLCDLDEVLSKSFSEALAADEAKMLSILAATKWDQLYTVSQSAWGRAKAVRSSAPSSLILKEQIADMRERYKKSIASKLKDFISSTNEEVLEDLRKVGPSGKGLFELVTEFEKRYKERKTMLNVLDFHDLEHETIRLLANSETGEKTATAVALSGKTVEILVDEYQDTNEVQETIFEALSNGTNRCMVGDVKQSIYAFRLADPTIFLKHYHAMKMHANAEVGEPRKILLTQNFRSRKEILSATNDVMAMCMSMDVGGIDYNEDERLKAGREDFLPTDGPAVELVTINMDDLTTGSDTDDEDEDAVAKIDIEAHVVANRIHKKLRDEKIMDEQTGEMRPVRPSDIAILSRSANSAAKHYVKALEALGIACTANKGGNILETTEVATLYSYLQVLDNPNQDIPLAALLASPLVCVEMELLSQIRVAKKDTASFYDALLEYSKKEGVRRSIIEFVSNLNELRAKVPYTKLSQLFAEIIEKTDADDVFGAMDNGDLRMANIYKFQEMISMYEAGGAHGLFEFLCYIESLRDSGAELPQATQIEAKDAVTFMSVHASKGLEFPIVILADTSRRFNRNDLRASALLHKELGVGLQVTDAVRKNTYPTIARHAISMAKDAEMKSEEMRILYVAMTRAKQQLIMMYSGKLAPTLSRLGSLVQNPLPPYASQAATSPGDWLLMAALARNESYKLWRIAGKIPSCATESEMPWTITCIDAAKVDATTKTMEELETSTYVAERPDKEPFDAPSKEDLERNLKYVYPHEKATGTAAKVVASAIGAQTKVTIRRPEFAKAAGKFSAAERGTATHLFMRYADYAKCCADGRVGIKEEIYRLVLEGYMRDTESKAIMVDSLLTLFKSKTGRSLAEMEHTRVKREYSFSMLVPANTIFEDGEYSAEDEILIQGVVDFHAVTDDGIILYDFKTDFVETPDDELARAAEYQPQMDIYAKALQTIYGLPVKEKAIIFLRTGNKVACKKTIAM